MELSRQMLLLTAVNYGSYYLHITKQQKQQNYGTTLQNRARQSQKLR